MFKKILFASYCVLFFLLLAALILFVPGPLRESTLIDTSKGDSAFTIANKLNSNGVIRNKYFFAYTMRIFGLDKRIVIGEFEVKKRASMASVISTIINNKKLYSRKITIPEGFTVAQVYALLTSNPYLYGGLPRYVKEGSLMPDTYYFHKGESRVSIVNRMYKSMLDYTTDLWKKRDPSLPFNSREDAITLASIVEKETAVPEERPLIAGVFINRLKLNMRLQSDPTVAYGLNMPNAKGLTRKQLRIKTPYNTYKIKGLPIGPIANPGRAAIYAVFYPAKTKYLYFVADGSGAHKFSADLKSHNKNVANWRKIESDNLSK